MNQDQGHDRAFNEGCDARLAATPRRANPYPNGTGHWQSWRRGWNHVDGCWGQANAQAPPLPEVRGVS